MFPVSTNKGVAVTNSEAEEIEDGALELFHILAPLGDEVCALSVVPWDLLKYIIKGAQEGGKALWSPFGGRGEMAMAMVTWLQVHQMLSLSLSNSDSEQNDASLGRHDSRRGVGEA